MPNTILKINDLNKSFGAIKAVNNISFTIEKGNVYGILGPNGSGKSTTLGIVLNVVNATSGTFEWFDGSLTTHEALKKVGAIIERPNFYPYMTAYQNLKLVCKIKQTKTSQIDEVLKIVGLQERKDSKFRTFSLGMKQRLAIASALLNNPEILILDEPTNGLDPQGIHQIREIIKKIAAKGTTILFASHLLDEVEKVCSHVVVLRKGKILYSGEVEKMINSYGYFELNSDQNKQLETILNQLNIFQKIEHTASGITAHLNQDFSAIELNKILVSKDVYLSHMVKKKESLEEQFLILTDKNLK